jgi:hypothetical protein
MTVNELARIRRAIDALSQSNARLEADLCNGVWIPRNTIRIAPPRIVLMDEVAQPLTREP